ncbi:MAG TPA: glycosyltransferase family 39 protein, partial [Planctomycetia bacterium]|nr:glycosyltransferase family 39 protein [Planctomycetia bacterium]
MIWRRPALWAAALALAGGVLRAQFVHFKTDLHPDERIVAGLVAADRQTGRLSANWACLEDPDYGRPTYQFSAYSLAVELAARAGRALTDHPADAGEAIRLGRWISCTCGAASLFLLFLAGRNLAGPAVGFLAQVFLLVAFLHVQDSGYARPEGMLSFAITFALWLWTRARFRPTVASWLCFGAAAGLAIAVKYSAAPLLLLLPLNRRAFVALLGLGAGFLLGTPEVLVDPAPLLAGIRFEAEHYRAGHIPHQSSGAWDFNALWYANYLCQLGWGWVPALLAAAFLLTPRLPSPDAQRLRLFAFAALFMIALPKVRFERNLEVAFPALAIAAAWQVQLFRSRFAGLPPRLG